MSFFSFLAGLVGGRRHQTLKADKKLFYANNGAYGEIKETIYTCPNKKPLICRVNNFRQVLQTSVCCPHRSFTVF